MLIGSPHITAGLRKRLDELDELRHTLGEEVGRPVPWLGTLRWMVQASAVESSTAIEGFHVSAEDAVALVSGTEEPGAEDLNRMAVACYAQAMEHVGVMAEDPGFRWHERVILDLHFDACRFQRDIGPGLWRTGPVGVTGADGRIVYEGPDPDEVPGLMSEVVEWLEGGDLDSHAVVRAAMAHLHVVSIHPFRDGNGRIARIAQSLVLAREGLVSPAFGSIEEYLGQNTPAYYAALQEAQGGRYQPERDASGWVRFCVEAHLAQARRRLAQIEEAGARWSFLEQLVERRGWPERLVIALEQSLVGGADRRTYAEEAEVSPATVSTDFRRLVDAGLVVPHGRGRTVRYVAADALRAEVAEITPAR